MLVIQPFSQRGGGKIKSALLPRLAVLVAVAVAATAVVATRSIGPFWERPRVTTSPTTEAQQPPPSSGNSPAAGADQPTPAHTGTYAGPLGDFIVAPRNAADFPPCPKPYRPAQNYKASELYSPVFGDLEGLEECADGKMLNITAAHGRALIGKRYFVGPARVPFEAPRERLVLLTIAGKPAIAKSPAPGYPGTLRLAVIQRFPRDNQPGIMAWIDNTEMSLEAAATLAEEIMGVR